MSAANAVPPDGAQAKEEEEKETGRCKCCTLEHDSGLMAFMRVQGDQEGDSQCVLRWSMEVASILIFIAASIYLALAVIQLPGKAEDILSPRTCLYKDGVVGSSYAQDDQEEICIELPQRVIDWAGWPDASLELADFSAGWNHSALKTLASGRTVRTVDPKQLRNDTFLALNFNTDRCNRNQELKTLFDGLVPPNGTFAKKDLWTSSSPTPDAFRPCIGCDQTCVEDGPLAKSAGKCTGYMPETDGTIDFGCTGVPLSPPFTMAVRLDERSWEETLNDTSVDPSGSVFILDMQNDKPTRRVKYKVSGGWSYSTFVNHLWVSVTSIIAAVVTITMSAVMRCNGQQVGKMPTAFPVGLLLLTAVTACVLVWAIYTDWKDLENWMDFAEKGTDLLWLPIRNLTDDLMWAESTPLPFEPTRFAKTNLGLADAKDDLVYQSLKQEVLFLYTARLILFMKQEKDAKGSGWNPNASTPTSNSDPQAMVDSIHRVRFLDTSISKPTCGEAGLDPKLSCFPDKHLTAVNISFPAWPGEASGDIGSIRREGGDRYPWNMEPWPHASTAEARASVLESCFPHYPRGSQNYDDFWAQDDLSYQYFRIQFDPTQYIVLFIVEIAVFGLYLLSSARLFFIVALMLKVRFLVRARNGACSNCNVVYTLNYWPFQCAMCGGHFCKVCANQSRLLVGETTRSVLALLADFLAPNVRVANTASTAHEARVCNTCYGVFPAVTSTGQVSVLLFTVTFHANHAHNLTRSP
jgi:hypothetical protein